MKLFVTESNQSSREVEVVASASLGRAAENTIPLADVSVGRFHARLEVRPEGAWIEDLGSTNGTFVNGVRVVADHPLRQGDRITLGSGTTLQVLELGMPVGAAYPSAVAPPVRVSPPAVHMPATVKLQRTMPASNWIIAGVVACVVLTVFSVVIYLIPPSVPPPQPSPSPSPSPTPSPSPAPTDPVPALVSALAGQLSSKPPSYFHFAPAMLEAIKARTEEYRLNVTPQAAAAKASIVQAFSVHRGLNPLYGFILALSRSQFQASQGLDYWRVPSAQTHQATDAAPSESAAEAAANHLANIRSVFPADEDFMYRIAVFGASRSRAGDLSAALQTQSDEARRDFWQMKQAGIVSQEEAERVVRFFAAGIVGENPRVFQIKDAKSFSEL